MIVSYGAGGSLDVIARPLAAALGEELGQTPFMVVNIPGASGTIGVKKARDAAPDGYTLLIGTASEVVLAPMTVKGAGYQASDLTAIGKIATSGIVIAARPGLNVNSLEGLIALARSKPGNLSYGVPGAGSFHEVAMASLMRKAGIKLTMIPYTSSAKVSTDVVGGHVDIAVVGLPAVLPLIEAGQMKALAVMGRDRDIGNPAIPAVRETKGFEDFNFDLWTGVFAPRGIPPAIKASLQKAVTKLLEQPALRKQYAKLGITTAEPRPSIDFDRYVKAEEAKLKEAVTAGGIVAQ